MIREWTPKDEMKDIPKTIIDKIRLNELRIAADKYCEAQMKCSDFDTCHVQCPLAPIDISRRCMIEEAQLYIDKAMRRR